MNARLCDPQVLPTVPVPLRKSGGRPLQRWPARCCPISLRPQWTYGLSAECISCGLSLAWPLPSYWKLKVAVCMQDFVLTGTACYYRWAPGSQETMVYSQTHLFQKKKQGTGYKEKKGGICLPAACIGCYRSECFALAKKAAEIFGTELKWSEKAELFPHVQSSSYVLSILAWGLFQPVSHSCAGII